MIPLSIKKDIVKLANYHAKLCKIIKVPDYQVNREIQLTSVGVLIGARVTVDAESKRFISRVANKYAPIKKSTIITPN